LESISFLKLKCVNLLEATIANHEKVGEAGEAKAPRHLTKTLMTPLVKGKGEPEALTRRRVNQQDPLSPYLFMLREKRSRPIPPPLWKNSQLWRVSSFV
jgi:hypothetical protein